MPYTYDDIRATLLGLGIQKDDVVLVRADLRYLGPYTKGSRALPEDWYNALTSVVDLDQGTIVTPTATIGLCNTDTVFDVNETPSEMGVVAEYIRKQPGAVRSFHPFLSYAAVGRDAEAICLDTTRHGFGPETPKARLIDRHAKVISIGIPPIYSCTTVHHVELMMGVPYRYVKEFMHPVVRDGEVRTEPFYLYVWYRECELKKDHNRKTMGTFGGLSEMALGNGAVVCYDMNEFYAHCVEHYKRDIYCWLEAEPKTRPYQR